jgi:hypothetical protein
MSDHVIRRIILLALAGIGFVGCAVTPEKSKPETKGVVVAARSIKKTPKHLSPKYLSVVAPLEGRSKPVLIGCGWTATFRTVPSGESLRIWVNGNDAPILFSFSQTPQFLEHAESLRFGSATGSGTHVKIVLYPPGVAPDLSVRSD